MCAATAMLIREILVLSKAHGPAVIGRSEHRGHVFELQGGGFSSNYYMTWYNKTAVCIIRFSTISGGYHFHI